MSEQKFTPGPWTISYSEAGTILIKPVGQVICELDPTPEMEANAKLICAAPDLLAALYSEDGYPSVAHILLRHGYICEAEKIEAAIKKAEGHE